MKIDPYKEAINMQRLRIRLRIARKKLRINQSSLQGLIHKARLIAAGKGRHGKSMSASLLNRHLVLIG